MIIHVRTLMTSSAHTLILTYRLLHVFLHYSSLKDTEGHDRAGHTATQTTPTSD